MIKLDLNKMVRTMSKTQIISLVEAQIDTAIALRIEEEALLAAYNQAKARVANDTYTIEDLRVLQDCMTDTNRVIIASAQMGDEQERKDAWRNPLAPLSMTLGSDFKPGCVQAREQEEEAENKGAGATATLAANLAQANQRCPRHAVLSSSEMKSILDALGGNANDFTF